MPECPSTAQVYRRILRVSCLTPEPMPTPTTAQITGTVRTSVPSTGGGVECPSTAQIHQRILLVSCLTPEPMLTPATVQITGDVRVHTSPSISGATKSSTAELALTTIPAHPPEGGRRYGGDLLPGNPREPIYRKNLLYVPGCCPQETEHILRCLHLRRNHRIEHLPDLNSAFYKDPPDSPTKKVSQAVYSLF